jgi:hypothetical protein
MDLPFNTDPFFYLDSVPAVLFLASARCIHPELTARHRDAGWVHCCWSFRVSPVSLRMLEAHRSMRM